jgi:hypothetical protein
MLKEALRLAKMKKGALVSSLRDREPLVHRYMTIFQQSVVEPEDEEDKVEGLKQWKEDFYKKYAMDWEGYILAGEICSARYPEDKLCNSDKTDWDYFHDFQDK